HVATLFPYTPLFRSDLRRPDVDLGIDARPELAVLVGVAQQAAAVRAGDPDVAVLGDHQAAEVAGAIGAVPPDRGVLVLLHHPVADRKSTRLNSSHVK